MDDSSTSTWLCSFVEMGCPLHTLKIKYVVTCVT